MAQHDFVIDDQNGLSFLADLNDVLSAIVSNNSGDTEPAETYAYQFWADTNSNILKIRNAADNAWLDVFCLTTGKVIGVLLLSGGTLTGHFHAMNGRIGSFTVVRHTNLGHGATNQFPKNGSHISPLYRRNTNRREPGSSTGSNKPRSLSLR